jgi:hypothetical protein
MLDGVNRTEPGAALLGDFSPVPVGSGAEMQDVTGIRGGVCGV